MAPQYWLMKSEPVKYSIDALARDKVTFWDGVRNYKARNLMRDDMKVGDQAFFYHSNHKPSAVAGIMTIASAAKPDPTQFDVDNHYYDEKSDPEKPRWWAVDVKFSRKFDNPVSLADVKADAALSDMALVKMARLSVQPVRPAEWRRVLKLAGED